MDRLASFFGEGSSHENKYIAADEQDLDRQA